MRTRINVRMRTRSNIQMSTRGGSGRNGRQCQQGRLASFSLCPFFSLRSIQTIDARLLSLFPFVFCNVSHRFADFSRRQCRRSTRRGNGGKRASRMEEPEDTEEPARLIVGDRFFVTGDLLKPASPVTLAGVNRLQAAMLRILTMGTWHQQMAHRMWSKRIIGGNDDATCPKREEHERQPVGNRKQTKKKNKHGVIPICAFLVVYIGEGKANKAKTSSLASNFLACETDQRIVGYRTETSWNKQSLLSLFSLPVSCVTGKGEGGGGGVKGFTSEAGLAIKWPFKASSDRPSRLSNAPDAVAVNWIPQVHMVREPVPFCVMQLSIV